MLALQQATYQACLFLMPANRQVLFYSERLHIAFLPARRYASAGYRDRNVSVRPSVCLSVRHTPVLCQNEES